MITTIAKLIEPDSSKFYTPLDNYALALRLMMATAYNYRDKGRWGDSGPSEWLAGYGSCTNSQSQPWHSGRQGITSYPEHVENMRDILIQVLCFEGGAIGQWKSEHNIGLRIKIKVPSRSESRKIQEAAWNQFFALNGFRMRHSINPCHSDVKVLCFPELVIGRHGIYLRMAASSASELRTGPTASRWDVGFLVHQPNPRWVPNRETFSAFIQRAIKHFTSQGQERIKKP